MPVAGTAVSHGASSHQLSASWGHVCIGAPEHEGQEAPGMVVEVAFVVATLPDVDPYGKQP